MPIAGEYVFNLYFSFRFFVKSVLNSFRIFLTIGIIKMWMTTEQSATSKSNSSKLVKRSRRNDASLAYDRTPALGRTPVFGNISRISPALHA